MAFQGWIDFRLAEWPASAQVRLCHDAASYFPTATSSLPDEAVGHERALCNRFFSEQAAAASSWRFRRRTAFLCCFWSVAGLTKPKLGLRNLNCFCQI
jgi:hypothetical protein